MTKLATDNAAEYWTLFILMNEPVEEEDGAGWEGGEIVSALPSIPNQPRKREEVGREGSW